MPYDYMLSRGCMFGFIHWGGMALVKDSTELGRRLGCIQAPNNKCCDGITFLPRLRSVDGCAPSWCSLDIIDGRLPFNCNVLCMHCI